MNTRDSQSSRVGNFPPYATWKMSVEAVPATSEVRRLTSPANVAVRPWNMKMNTEKNAVMPNMVPAMAAPIHAGCGLRIAAWNTAGCEVVGGIVLGQPGDAHAFTRELANALMNIRQREEFQKTLKEHLEHEGH